MAFARNTNFPNKTLKLAALIRALNHPARIIILETLAKRRECICGDLVTDLPLAQSTVSQHLKALKMAGFIKGEIDGPRSKYCVDWKNFESFLLQMDLWTKKMSSFKKRNRC